MGLIVVVVLAVIAAIALRAAWLAEQVRAARRRRAERDTQMHSVALDAAMVEPIFDPDTVHQQVAELFVEIQAAWTDRNRGRLRQLVGPDLMVEWERRLDDFDRRGWRNIVQVVDGPTVQYISLANRGEKDLDRVVVFIEAVVADYVQVEVSGMILTHDSGSSPRTRVGEYWTLAPHDDHWMLISIEQPAEGEYHLHERPIPRPEDDEHLRDDTFLAMAAADKLPEGFTPADLINVEFAQDARAAALDLSLADPRFSLDVLETSVRQVIEAWAQAVDGADTPLEAIATHDAVDQLLYDSDARRVTRVVVRGPMVRHVTVAQLDVTHQPPRMRVDAELGGFRYVEDRDTVAVLEGSKTRPSAFAEQFTLELVDGSAARPWQVVAAARLPGQLKTGRG
jgi:predicted lipid-binding transport protein (Tim44 family)